MISARTFARQSAVWNDCAPLMERFVRWTNLNEVRFAAAVKGLAFAESPALVSEAGFELAADRRTGRVRERSEILASVRANQVRLPGGNALPRNMSYESWRQAEQISESICSSASEDAVFRPQIPGCGVVDLAYADILAGRALIEVKSVTRAFRGSDVRQLLTYAAMLHASGRSIDTVVLLNPRTGLKCDVSLAFLAQSVAGVSAVTLLDGIVGWMSGLQVSA